MKIFKDIEQGTEDWHRLRWGKIGGTRAKGLFVKSDNLMIELLSEITEDFELEDEGFKSMAMLRGQDLEPMALREVIEYTGIDFKTVGWLEREDNSLLGFSPDGISPCEEFMCEIKCPESKRHIKTCLSKEIPGDNLDQCIHAFTVNDKLKKLFFVSFRPEAIKKIIVIPIDRETIVNIGTNAKPVLKTVDELVSMAVLEAAILKMRIEQKIEQLRF